ncbi:MAG: hypothetical protein HGN29_07390 [Asgard group archaeon]|nr:hypothetical protein [Asgard group archaeon]
MKKSRTQKKYISGISLILMFLLLGVGQVSVKARPPRGPGAYGYVYDDNGTNPPIYNAKVTLIVDGNVEDVDYTDSAGYYSVLYRTLLMEPYPAELVIEKTGFQTEGIGITLERFLAVRQDINLIPTVPSVFNALQSTLYVPTTNIDKGESYTFTFDIHNTNNYYTLKNLKIYIHLKNEGYLVDEQGVFYFDNYLDYDGWFRYPIPINLEPSQQQNGLASSIDKYLTLYKQSRAWHGIFALNIGEYDILGFYLTGDAFAGNYYAGSFQTSIQSLTKTFFVNQPVIVPVFTYTLVDFEWFNYFETFPQEYFNQVSSRFQTYEMSISFDCCQTLVYPANEPDPPNNMEEWETYGREKAGDMLGLSVGGWDYTEVENYQVSQNNHGFDKLAFFVGEKEQHWGVCCGKSYIVCYFDRDLWNVAAAIVNAAIGYPFFPYELPEWWIDNLIQHEISHSFGAEDHGDWGDSYSVMTYLDIWNPIDSVYAIDAILNGLYCFQLNNWLDDDVTTMSSSIDLFWSPST